MSNDNPAPADKYRPDSGLWKDHINRNTITKIANVFGRAYPLFDRSSFVDTVVTKEFLQLELKDRINRVAQILEEYLPSKYSTAVKVLIKAAPHLGEFENWILTSYVEQFGLDNFDDSMIALKGLTPYGTSEFAIRPFMIKYTAKMMPLLKKWATDKNEHIRRLAAEGCRPRGVWVAHIEEFKKNPKEVLELLEMLKEDPSMYVRKAVANNLNDISKEHPKLVIQIGKRWKKDKNRLTDWIIKHACRSLIKQGVPEVFPLFGFTSNPKIELNNFKISKKKINLPEKLSFNFSINSLAGKTQKLAIDYKVFYVKKTGGLSPKVFKLSEKYIKPDESLSFSKNHLFKNNSTRKHYPGKHKIELIVNGIIFGVKEFSLIK